MMGPPAGRIVPFNAALARAIPRCGPRTGPAAPGTRPNSGRPARAQLEQLLEREGSVAWAVDDGTCAWARRSHPTRSSTETSSTSGSPSWSGTARMLQRSRPCGILWAVSRQQSSCARPQPGMGRRVRGAPPEVSDRSYGLILWLLAGAVRTAGLLQHLGLSAIKGLDEINRVLVQRGLLPLSRSSEGLGRSRENESQQRRT